ncbi:MAG TPA: DUF4358 domain-containing protein [Candidatus Gallacutalibacter stercoravium]|nr:DUF4358 domain-containing protein [Candidatus Gallacutalibacter stercoravium]
MKKIVSVVCLLLAVFVAGCSQQTATNENVDLSAVLTDMQEQVTLENTIAVDDSVLTNYGISMDDVVQYAGVMDATGIKCEEIILIEAKDADAASRVKEKLDARYDAKLAQNIDYLPEQYAIIEKCEVTQNGNFVSMIVGAEGEKLTEIYQSYVH